MRIHVLIVYVDDQDMALEFYIELRFVKETGIPLGESQLVNCHITG